MLVEYLSCGGVSNMLLVLSITFHYHYNWVVYVRLAHLSSCDWNDIFIDQVIIIIKMEVLTLSIVIICFHGCVPDMFVTSYSVTWCINILGKPGFCFLSLRSLWWVQIIGYFLACRSYLFVHYTIPLTSMCKLIWKHWTDGMPII